MMAQRPEISACIITFNEEENIRRCLASVKWCDEIVILDSFSTDRTLEVCREYTEKIYQQQWLGYIKQRNCIREMASHDWVLFLDADEEVSISMRDQILEEFRRGPGDIVGYRFPRQVFYLGKWIKHGEWYPDIKLRLFQKERGISGGEEPHDMVLVDGPVKNMHGIIHHYTYESIADHVDQQNRFSQISAEEKFKNGQRFTWPDFLVRPGFRFFKSLVLKQGFLDRRRGFLIATISAFGVLIKYAKLWELELNARNQAQAEAKEKDLSPDESS